MKPLVIVKYLAHVKLSVCRIVLPANPVKDMLNRLSRQIPHCIFSAKGGAADHMGFRQNEWLPSLDSLRLFAVPLPVRENSFYG
jgi:hypothetical protein